MVVFEDGKPRKSDYRRFRIKSSRVQTTSPAIRRSLAAFQARGAAEEGTEDRWRLPDLVIVDGGKGQFSAATESSLSGLEDVPIVGLAKENEEFFLPGRAAVLLPRHRRHSTSSNVCATRPTVSRSPITATCGRRPRSAPPSTTCPASARSASRPSCGSSVRPSASATRRSSRSPQCRGSDRPGRPDQGDAGGLGPGSSAIVRRDAQTWSSAHPDHRDRGPCP